MLVLLSLCFRVLDLCLDLVNGVPLSPPLNSLFEYMGDLSADLADVAAGGAAGGLPHDLFDIC